MNKIIQKDITFDFIFIFSIFGVSKGLRVLRKKYDVENVKKSWSWKKPFYVKVVARVNVKHDVDIEKMRQKQHELLMEKGD